MINRHSLTRMATLFDKMKPCHMSGDEAEIDADDNDRQMHPRVFYIVDAFWQSKEFKTGVRVLDGWNVEDWRQCVGDTLPGGNAPRRRIGLAEPRVVNSKAPKGLWKNCYNKKWLRTLKPHVRRKLRIINADFDFSLPTYTKPKNLTDMGDFEEDEEDDDDEGEEEAKEEEEDEEEEEETSSESSGEEEEEMSSESSGEEEETSSESSSEEEEEYSDDY